MKVEVESENENIADRIGVTSSDMGATTKVEGAMTICTFSGNGVDSFVVGWSTTQAPLIKKITVTYQ